MTRPSIAKMQEQGRENERKHLRELMKLCQQYGATELETGGVRIRMGGAPTPTEKKAEEKKPRPTLSEKLAEDADFERYQRGLPPG